ncbi:carboxymuconolactone decarboxylase family protein [Corynebacterium flavescens]|uniref:Alkyl hydroperoxide reductase AhpD n=1 Tax=Corynebacterium flavescens TaxID=28028 RepID=A0A1L7CMB3_CORFL|nr:MULTISPECIES: carboxymuconolactone decarboxylase family protein [Corynebacterium]APT87003.1 alkyl hydroperoxide reductase [Corynebacterium flavescens]KAA8721833.1 alkyl hydroperoxide reductase [Corynebacterium flavescens]MDN6098842.1 carboxymuconolactone decarboxylase family protein [Corynebacterium flavescens]MDN6199408.1 carboxymuconolactone decarboxylase family protein [Corynebacterium flavescens]MDN6226052.1 carboxymuconolactone decarboxylase family protein [Corynebacterium flavescens]
MSIENLKSSLPAYAKDQKLNLGSLTRSTELNEEQLWGSLLSAAAATRNDTVLAEVIAEAKDHLSDEAVEAALGAATVMAMNNVAYRAKGWLGDDFAQVKFGLRMNIIAKPGVEKANFELWNTVVSAINGCEHCLVAHTKTLQEEGLTKEQIWEAVKIGAVIQAVAQTVQIEAAR